MTGHPGGSPVSAMPARRGGSIRRTTTHDSTRPQGLDGPVALVATGRDLLTGSDGTARELDAARIEALVDYGQIRILSFESFPPEPAFAALAGKGAYAGFRKTVEEALPGEMDRHSVRAQLLDDLPPAVMANGRSLRVEGKMMFGERKSDPRVDICAGYAEGGTLLSGFTDLGPPLQIGPPVPPLDGGDDPLAWHAFAPLPPHGTRRARRLDVWREADRGWADCFFRDSHVDRHGHETVVHEWRLLAEIDLVRRLFVAVRADAGPLPYPECPGSGGSAARLAGMPIDGLRRAVRSTFVGPSTCTHLNDSYRAMEDVGVLIDQIG
jgi:hypothetical protein